MQNEVIRLLQLFGVPYVIAPMEAEAQCAYLESEGLVDGVVTEDSDALLFGAKSVYRHFFSTNKHPEVVKGPAPPEFLMLKEDVVRCFRR